jgi:3-oxoacyl-[acyl-carrier protein] reductase
MNSFSKCIATEFAAEGITANVICPGYFDTPLVAKLATKYAKEQNISIEKVLESWENYAPCKRFGHPEELAALVAYLASPLGGFCNGTSIVIDGGAIKQY